MIYGHFTIYSKTIVFRPSKVIIYHNIYCRQPIGGNGIGIWNPLSDWDKEKFRDGRMVRSIFVTLGLMHKADTQTFWLSFTGRMPPTLSCSDEVAEEVQYEGCDAVAQFWNYRTDGGRNYASDAEYKTYTDANEQRFNVICMQDFQQKFNPVDRAYSLTTMNAGHWGTNSCYPGAAQVMRGALRHFDPPKYMPTSIVALRR